jgi:hypothetical protein
MEFDTGTILALVAIAAVIFIVAKNKSTKSTPSSTRDAFEHNDNVKQSEK